MNKNGKTTGLVLRTLAIVGLLQTEAAVTHGQERVPPAAPAVAAKDIFLRPSAGPASANPTLAMNYRIYLQRGSDVALVAPDYAFKKGDCFRLGVRANADGHLYLLHKGTSGAGRFLFPDRRLDSGKNSVKAYQEHVVPAEGWFEFDGTPGTEVIHIVCSPEPLPQLAPLIGADPIPASGWRQIVEEFVANYNQLVARVGTKDIVYVETGRNAVAVVNGSSGEPNRDSPLTNPHAAGTQATNSAGQPNPGSQIRPNETHQTGPASGNGNSPATRRPATESVTNSAGPTPSPRVQVFVAQAAVPGGAGNVLVHTVSLKHE